MASVSVTAGRFATRAVPAGIRDRARDTHAHGTGGLLFQTAERAARLREAYEACEGAFSKALSQGARRKALRGFWPSHNRRRRVREESPCHTAHFALNG